MSVHPDSLRARALSDDERWIMSFYRVSELSGSLFFGQIARAVPSGQVQIDLTRHFADEARHAHLWTSCLESLGHAPIKLRRAYQDQYLESAGLPANMLDVLAITHVFEHRVVDQYTRHLKASDVHPAIAGTIRRILRDEGWHLHWVGQELERIAGRRGQAVVDAALQRCRSADQEVFANALREFGDHLSFPGAPPLPDVVPVANSNPKI